MLASFRRLAYSMVWAEIADISNDSVGQALASAELPKRVHLKRTPVPTDHG